MNDPTEAEPGPEPGTQKLAIRGCDAWVAWIDRAARLTHRTRSSLIEAALAAFAVAEGLEGPPPRVGTIRD